MRTGRLLPLIFLLLVAVASPAPSAPQTAGQEAAALEAMEKGPAQPAAPRRQVFFDPKNPRDPFQGPLARPPESQEGVGPGQEGDNFLGGIRDTPPPLPPVTVQGIVWGGLFPQAIIDNKVYKVGDKFKVPPEEKEITIVSIDKNGVMVMFADKPYNLSSPAGRGSVAP